MPEQVFLSYSWKDRDRAEFRALVEDLTMLDRAPWYDQQPRGDLEWWRDVLERIARCDVFVVALTPAFLRSTACRRELRYALDAQRHVLPVSLDVLQGVEIPEELRAVQVVDYADCCTGTRQASRCTARLAQMLEVLRSSGPAPSTAQLPPAPEMPPPYASTLTPYLEGEYLTPSQQAAMLDEVRRLSTEEPDDRLLDALKRLLERADLAWTVRPELADLAERLQSRRGRGAVVAEDGRSRVAPTAAPPSRSQSRVYRAPGMRLATVVDDLTRFLDRLGMTSVVTREPDGGFEVRSEPGVRHRRLTGSGASLTTRLALVGDDMTVTVSGQRWGDKVLSLAGGVAATVATSGFALPLIAPSMVGAYRQATLPDKVFQHLDQVTG